MCLLQNLETLGPVVVHGDMNIGQHTLATYNIYVKRDTNVYSILDILFSVTQWSWTDVYDDMNEPYNQQHLGSHINIVYDNIVQIQSKLWHTFLGIMFTHDYTAYYYANAPQMKVYH